MKIFNTLTRKIEEFEPIDPPKVGLYTCGPTVYYYPQIGNWRTFVFEDVLRRTLEYFDYDVNHVMNVTDVGHLTGDNVGDADLGEDRMEKAAKKEGKTSWDIANFYIKDFIESREKLNILAPTRFVRATDHIAEQIGLIKKLEDRGLTYVTKLGVYFDVSKFPDYGKLGGQKLIDKRNATREELKEDLDKKNPYDFALWKFSYAGGRSFDSAQDDASSKRHMEWESPWGRGFPGWHIECSAMSMKYLGETLDIHTGGIDHIAIHHTNEIAQSEGATGKQFARYWMHGEFLKVDGGRMGKSLGNAYNLADITNKGFDPVALRYLYLTSHYRDVLNFTWDSLTSAQMGLSKLRTQFGDLRVDKSDLSEGSLDFETQFKEAIANDLNTPQALAILWKVLKSDLTDGEKRKLVIQFDKVLGLRLDKFPVTSYQIPEEIIKIAEKREKYREGGNYEESDNLRKEIEERGFQIKDDKNGYKLRKI